MYLLENTPEAEAMRENVFNLLSSDDDANFELALQIMEAGGFILETTAIIWANILHTETKKQQKVRLNYLKKRLSPDVYALLEKSTQYKTHFQVFARYHFDTLAQHEFMGWQRLAQYILPYAFSYEQEKTDELKLSLLEKPEIPKLELLRAMMNEYKEIYFYNVPLKSLPDEIGELHDLLSLRIQYTQVAVMPESFFNLKNLTTFSFNDTPLAKNEAFLAQFKQCMPLIWAQNKIDNEMYNLDFEGKIALCKEILAACPTHLDTLISLLSAYEDLKDANRFEKALLAYKEFQYLDTSNHASLSSKVGYLYYSLGDYENSLKYYQRALDLEPNYDENWCNVSCCYRELKQYQEAINTANQAVTLGSIYFRTADVLYYAYKEAGDYQNAVKTCQQYLASYTGSEIPFRFRLALAYEGLGQTADAEKCYQEIFSYRNEEWEDWYELAEVYRHKGMEKDAIKFYKKHLENGYEKLVDARSELGILYLKNAKTYIEAEILFAQNIEEEPQEARHYYNFSCAMALQKYKTKALELLQKAIDLDASYGEWVRTDTDFKAYWQDADFVQLTTI
jgi:tetratricopeptide (TPR) repeat protein